jgi:HTH-type transcriptional regulator/antitoxin HipB
MAHGTGRKSLKPGALSKKPSAGRAMKSDEPILKQLRQARTNRGLTQGELASRSGLGQSQISQLEWGIVDPRLSTIRDLARVLDLELMLIPRQDLSAVEGLLRGTVGGEQPLYDLEAFEHEELDGLEEPARRHRGRRRRSVR